MCIHSLNPRNSYKIEEASTIQCVHIRNCPDKIRIKMHELGQVSTISSIIHSNLKRYVSRLDNKNGRQNTFEVEVSASYAYEQSRAEGVG